MGGNRDDDAAVRLRFNPLPRMPRVFQDPAGSAGRDANLEVARFAAGENADPLTQMRFQVEIRRPPEEGIERHGPQKAVELQVANAIFPDRNLMSRGNDIQTALIKHDRVRLDLS